jgi:hypothetical protein
MRVSGEVIADVTGQRQDLESGEDQAEGEDEVGMPEAFEYASAAGQGHDPMGRIRIKDGTRKMGRSISAE